MISSGLAGTLGGEWDRARKFVVPDKSRGDSRRRWAAHLQHRRTRHVDSDHTRRDRYLL
jgi:hypothetical protein